MAVDTPAQSTRTGGDEWRSRLGGSSAPGRAIFLAIASGALFTVNDAIMKLLREDFPVGEAVFLRGLLATGALLGVTYFVGGWRTLRVQSWTSQLQRAALVIVSTVSFVGALRYLPLADAMGIAFTGPLFTVALAGFFLGEATGWRRWSAAGVGFCGLLLMLGPGMQLDLDTVRWALLLPLAAAVGGALRDIVTRRMSLTDHSNATLLVSLVGVTLFGAISLPLGAVIVSEQWIAPTPWQFGLFTIAAVLVASGQYCLIEALRVGEAGLLAPFKYVNYVWALGLGFLFWGDLPTAASLAGVMLVIGSGIYIFLRERALARRARSSS
ncbi:MAG: DMT family transporter [Gammaproteobacteria bacterium]|nr:DMT family transporter [Gammaproteobacteria bacterium]